MSTVFYGRDARQHLANYVRGLPWRREPATLPQAGAAPIFRITGGSMIVTGILGEVMDRLGDVGNMSLEMTTTAGAVVPLCAPVAAGGLAPGTLLSIDGAKDAPMNVGAGAVMMQTRWVAMNEGTLDLRLSGSGDGLVKWTIFFVPVGIGGDVTVA